MGSNMSELRTSNDLLEALQKVAARKLTAKEILEQRVSFVFGSIDVQSDVTRERVKEVLVQQQGDLAR